MEKSLTDLPPNVLSEILSRLPIKSLFACRSVCKTFLGETSSNPRFNSLFSSNTPQALIIQFGNPYNPTRSVQLVDAEHDTAFGVGDRVQINDMFQIPTFPAKYFQRYHPYAREQDVFVLVNSCNGLLYFAERIVCERSFICNPITNEYGTLLELNPSWNARMLTMGLWLGFSPAENRYKALRIFATVSGTPLGLDLKQEFWAQLHTVGSSSWRDIEDRPPSGYLSWDTCFVIFNGNVYWLCKFPEISWFILFFDFETEKFGRILPPPCFGFRQLISRQRMSIGILGGYLCVTDDTRDFEIWVLKNHGRRDSWTKEFIIDTSIPFGIPLKGPFRPLQILQNGKILLLGDESILVCYDPREKSFQFFEFSRARSSARFVPYTPSFVPLKDALMIDSATVQSITPRA